MSQAHWWLGLWLRLEQTWIKAGEGLSEYSLKRTSFCPPAFATWYFHSACIFSSCICMSCTDVPMWRVFESHGDDSQEAGSGLDSVSVLSWFIEVFKQIHLLGCVIESYVSETPTEHSHMVHMYYGLKLCSHQSKSSHESHMVTNVLFQCWEVPEPVQLVEGRQVPAGFGEWQRRQRDHRRGAQRSPRGGSPYQVSIAIPQCHALCSVTSVHWLTYFLQQAPEAGQVLAEQSCADSALHCGPPWCWHCYCSTHTWPQLNQR